MKKSRPRQILLIFLILFVNLVVYRTELLPIQSNKVENIKFSATSALTPIRLTFNSSSDSFPTVGISPDGNKIIIVWASDRTGFSRLWMINSSDGGESWSEATQLTFGSNFQDGWPDITFNSNGTAFLVWFRIEATQKDIQFMNSTDGGQSWSSPQNLTNDTFRNSYPDITVDAADNLFVVWSSQRNGNESIWLLNSSDDGKTWSDPIELAPPNSSNPFIACKSSNYCLVGWFSVRSEGSFDYRFSTNGGQTWSPIEDFIDVGGWVYRMDAQFDFNGDLLLIYCDYQLYFERSTDDGKTWGGYGLLNSSWRLYQGKFSISPSGKVILAWSGEYAGGDREIWIIKIDPPIDPDGDLLSTFEELILFQTNPNSSDSDGDGLSDKDEIDVHATDPLKSDSDGDGFSDGTEVRWGTNPLSFISNPLTRIIIITIPVSIVSLIIIKILKRKRIS